MGREIESEVAIKREREREGKREKGGKINCCFIMFSSDMTLAVIMAGLKI